MSVATLSLPEHGALYNKSKQGNYKNGIDRFQNNEMHLLLASTTRRSF